MVGGEESSRPRDSSRASLPSCDDSDSTPVGLAPIIASTCTSTIVATKQRLPLNRVLHNRYYVYPPDSRDRYFRIFMTIKMINTVNLKLSHSTYLRTFFITACVYIILNVPLVTAALLLGTISLLRINISGKYFNKQNYEP